MANEVEPKLWKAACAAVRRYFKYPEEPINDLNRGMRTLEQASYRTGWIMGYRAGRRSKLSDEV